jgi:hypothetical protein
MVMTGRQSNTLLFHVFDIQGHALAWHRSWRAARGKTLVGLLVAGARERARSSSSPRSRYCPDAARVDREHRARLRDLPVCSDETVLRADPLCRGRMSSPSTARIRLQPRVVA